MVRTCIACGYCDGANDVRRTFFAVPKGVDRALWSDLLACVVDPEKKQFVCADHFVLNENTKRRRLNGAVPIKYVGKKTELVKFKERNAKKGKEIKVKKPKIVNDGEIGLDYRTRVYVAWGKCACCLEVCRGPNLEIDSEGIHGCKELNGLLCYKCRRFSRGSCNDFCKYSYELNNLDPGSVPPELELGYMELQAVRLVQPFISVVRHAKTVTKVKGQMVHIASSVEKSVASLGRHCENTFFVATSQVKGESETVKYAVNDVAVYRALVRLKVINPLYFDVCLKDIAEEMEDVVYDLNCRSIDVYDSHALIDIERPIPKEYTYGLNRILPSGTEALWKMSGEDNKIEEKSYPNLFPEGKNGEYELRLYPLKSNEYYKLRLLSSNGRFQKDVSYVFRALNIVQRSYFESQINYVLRNGGKQIGERSMKEILEVIYPSIGKRIRGSQAYFGQLRQHLRNMIIANVAPQLFITINLRHSPELLCYVDSNKYGTMDAPNWIAIDSVTEDEFIAILNENCGVAAKMFQTRAEAFKTFLCSEKSGAFPNGIFATDVFLKIEFQRSGNPHIHSFTAGTSSCAGQCMSMLD